MEEHFGSRARRWLYLPVEVKLRELESRLFLGCHAAEAGYGVVIGKKYPLNELAAELPRGLYVDKSCQPGALHDLRYRHAAGHVLCALDEEGVVYEDADAYASSRLSPDTLAALRRFFAWGDDQASVIHRHFPAMDDRVAVTGNPRVDLWRPELRGIYHSEADALYQELGDYVLMSSSYGRVFRGPDAFVPANVIRARRSGDEPERLAQEQFDYTQHLLDAMVEAVDRLARAFPDLTIVVRPHQSEDPEFWNRVAARGARIVVRREGPITPWVLGAAVVLHNNSTTGVESLLLGRPTITYAPLQDPRFDMNIPNAVSTRASDEDELIALVGDALRGAPAAPPAAGLSVLAGHIAALDGPLAGERIMDEIEVMDLPVTAPRRSTLDHLARRARTAPLGVRYRAHRIAARRRSGDSTPALPPGYRERFLGSELSEVQDFLRRLSEQTGRFTGVRCAEIRPDVYLLDAPAA